MSQERFLQFQAAPATPAVVQKEAQPSWNILTEWFDQKLKNNVEGRAHRLQSTNVKFEQRFQTLVGKRGFRKIMEVLIWMKLTWRWRGKQQKWDWRYYSNQSE